jgi:hypothetical protein
MSWCSENLTWRPLTGSRHGITASIHDNVKNYSSFKRGVYRPDSTYKTAKMIYQKAGVDSCNIERKKMYELYTSV